MSGIDRKYVDAVGDQWTWHHDGQDRMTSEAHPGLNYAPYYVDERYGPLAAVELVAAAEARGYARAAAWLESEEVHALLLAHSRFRIQDCRCGWAELGKSHFAHVQAVLAAALTQQEGPEYPLASGFTDRAAALTEEGGQ